MQRSLALVLLTACSGDDAASCDGVAIAQGVYGRVMYVSDVGDMMPTPVANERVDVLDAPRGTAIANATSNADGRFEIALEPGSYALCPPPPSECATFSVASGQRVRAELTKTFVSSWMIDPGACD